LQCSTPSPAQYLHQTVPCHTHHHNAVNHPEQAITTTHVLLHVSHLHAPLGSPAYCAYNRQQYQSMSACAHVKGGNRDTHSSLQVERHHVLQPHLTKMAQQHLVAQHCCCVAMRQTAPQPCTKVCQTHRSKNSQLAVPCICSTLEHYCTAALPPGGAA
jgi:hypothetical protein